MNPIIVRPLQPDDSLELLTDLIHQAYASHATQGLRYWGTHQTVADTATRFASGHGFVAEVAGQIAGTITLRPPQPDSPVALYQDADTWSISQFAVAPSHKGIGVGFALHEHARSAALAHGARRMALDTAVPAEPLIALYAKWGYRIEGEHDWRPHTNYLSVLMTCSLILPLIPN